MRNWLLISDVFRLLLSVHYPTPPFESFIQCCNQFGPKESPGQSLAHLTL
jgi:hypothetical protein